MPDYPLEIDVQIDLVDYVLEEYPNIVFRSDLGGVRFTPGLARKVARLQRGRNLTGPRFAFPDFFVYEPINGYSGLAVEIKRRAHDMIRIKSNTLRLDNDHIREQYEALLALRQRGFYGDFAPGLERCKQLVDWYLAGATGDYWQHSYIKDESLHK